jgi:hypothetical protein
MFTSKQYFHRKDAKYAKFFIILAKEFLCVLCVFAVSWFAYGQTLNSRASKRYLLLNLISGRSG